MRRLFYTLALVVTVATASFAQKKGIDRPKETPEKRAEKIALTMQQKLSLTADQKLKVEQVELDRIKKNEEWNKKDAEATKGTREERKAFNKASKDKIESILTPDQKKVAEKMKAERHNKHKKAGKPRGVKTNPRP